MEAKVRRHALGVIIALILEFILGMVLNVFVNIPTTHPGSSGGDYFSRSGHSYVWALSNGGGIVLLLHVLVGTAILLGSIGLLARAIMYHSKRWIWVAAIGLLGISGAFGNGLSFLDFGESFSSFNMAMGFTLAAVSYVTGIFLSLRREDRVHTS